MTIKTISRMGKSNLFEGSTDVSNLQATDIIRLIQDLHDTMIAKGGVGIAAPQIGVNKRVIIFGFDKSERYPNEKAVPKTTLINPQYKPLNDEKELGWEGCLSVPKMRGLVPRYTAIRYWGTDENGNHVEREAHHFHARVVQHEIDHVDGVLYPLRIEDFHDFGFEDILWEKITGQPYPF